MLIENGADINIQDNLGRTALFYAIRKNNLNAITKNIFDIFNMLIEKGADINIQDKYGDTPLMYLIKNTSIDIKPEMYIKNMIEKRNIIQDIMLKLTKSVDMKNANDGNTALMFSYIYKKYYYASFLIEKMNADINISNKDGDNPLLYIIKDINVVNNKNKSYINKYYKSKYYSFLKLLLTNPKINLNIQDKDKKSPLQLAFEYKFIILQRLLIFLGAERSTEMVNINKNNKIILQKNLREYYGKYYDEVEKNRRKKLLKRENYINKEMINTISDYNFKAKKEISNIKKESQSNLLFNIRTTY